MRNSASAISICISIALAFHPCAAAAIEFSDAVAIVNYDVASGEKLGEFPSRAMLAKLVARIGQARPRAIVIKFFLDTPGKESDSKLLVAALADKRIFLQASINAEPPTSKFLEGRFFYNEPLNDIKPAISGDEGWLPLKPFADKATKVCFVDVVKPELVPMLTSFQGKPVPSMYACILAEAIGKNKMIMKDRSVQFGDYSIATDGAGQVAIPLVDLTLPSAISAFDVHEGKSGAALTGKVVVLIYTGNRSPTIAVRGVQVKVHQVFVAELRALFAQLKP